MYIVKNIKGTYYYKDPEHLIRHRIDGPAVEDIGGYKAWWINGERHREDGPARIYSDGYKEYYLNNKYFSRKKYIETLKLNLKCKVKIKKLMEKLANE